MDRMLRKGLIGLLLFGIFSSANVYAAVTAPFISIEDVSIDAGTLGNSGNLSIDATALSVTAIDGTSSPVFANFSLTGLFSGLSNSTYNFGNGTVAIGEMLSATFNNLTINKAGSNSAVFSADLTYIGGNEIVGLTSGRLEGRLYGLSGALDGSFTTTNTFIAVGKISPVPLPAALWLFLPMLAGLYSIASRNKDTL